MPIRFNLSWQVLALFGLSILASVSGGCRPRGAEPSAPPSATAPPGLPPASASPLLGPTPDREHVGSQATPHDIGTSSPSTGTGTGGSGVRPSSAAATNPAGIAYRKVGRYVRFHPDDLAEYVAAHRVEVPRVASGRLRSLGGRR